MPLDHEFLSFLVQAKKTTYASGSGALIEPRRMGSKDLPYQDGDYAYMDSYFGEINFIGQEIVWHQEKALWGMNYYGYTHDPIEGFPDFLFECLKQVTSEAPYRGPKHYKNDIFKYHCSWTGDINKFKGEESIRFEDRVIFSLLFHGGNIQHV